MNDNSATTCKHCKTRPVFPGYEYCGRTCGKAAKAQAPGGPKAAASFLTQLGSTFWATGQGNTKSSTSGDDDGNGASSSRAGGSAGPSLFLSPPTQRMCIGCNFLPANGRYDYCSKACAVAFAPKSPGFRLALPAPRRTRSGFLTAQNTGVGDDDDSDDGVNGDGDGDESDDEGKRTRHAKRKAMSHLVVRGRGTQLCLNCRMSPKVPPFDFCSKSCKAQAQAKLNNPFYQPQPLSSQFTGSGFISTNITGGVAGPSSSSSFTFPALSPYGMPPPPYTYDAAPPPTGPPCTIPGCTRLTPTANEKYCSVVCKKAAVTQGLAVACLLCKELPKVGQFHWCGPVCRRKAETGAPMLLELPSTDPKFADIVNQFTVTWSSKKGTAPTIHKIYKCINTKSTEDSFQQYRQQVESVGQFAGLPGKTAGNENRRWHGTIRKCTIGDSSTQLTPCSSSTCFVCCIIKTGFDVKYAANGWYGTGLYCSSHSSTSNGYTKGSAYAKGLAFGSQYRAMFLNRVIVGNEYVWGKTNRGTDVAARALVAPPDGYDSVASDTKHDEIIVYRNEAMVPSWLIIYA